MCTSYNKCNLLPVYESNGSNVQCRQGCNNFAAKVFSHVVF